MYQDGVMNSWQMAPGAAPPTRRGRRQKTRSTLAYLAPMRARAPETRPDGIGSRARPEDLPRDLLQELARISSVELYTEIQRIRLSALELSVESLRRIQPVLCNANQV